MGTYGAAPLSEAMLSTDDDLDAAPGASVPHYLAEEHQALPADASEEDIIMCHFGAPPVELMAETGQSFAQTMQPLQVSVWIALCLVSVSICMAGQ